MLQKMIDKDVKDAQASLIIKEVEIKTSFCLYVLLLCHLYWHRSKRLIILGVDQCVETVTLIQD